MPGSVRRAGATQPLFSLSTAELFSVQTIAPCPSQQSLTKAEQFHLLT